MQRIPEYADYVSASDECEALALELRGPDGSVIPTEDICVRDLEFLLTLSDEAEQRELNDDSRAGSDSGARDETLASIGLDDWDARWDASVDEDDRFGYFEAWSSSDDWRGEQEEREWPRYQLQVELVDDWSIP